MSLLSILIVTSTFRAYLLLFFFVQGTYGFCEFEDLRDEQAAVREKLAWKKGQDRACKGFKEWVRFLLKQSETFMAALSVEIDLNPGEEETLLAGRLGIVSPVRPPGRI